MMSFIQRFKSQRIGFYLQLAALILSLIPVFYIANVGSPMDKVPEEYSSARLFLIIGFIVEFASLIFVFYSVPHGEYLKIMSVLFTSLALAYFATGSVLSIIDKIYNIVMWGDSSQVPAIYGYGALLLASVLLNVVSCFLTPRKETV
jgi:hypothetical protein